MNTISNREPTLAEIEEHLKEIEKHLKRQDKDTKYASYGSYGAVGVSIILVGISLWIGSKILSASTLFWDYIFLIAVGFVVMLCSGYKQWKMKD